MKLEIQHLTKEYAIIQNQDNVTNCNTDRLADFISARNEYKYQSTVTASKAERLDYQFISKLPHITSSTTYLSTYTFNDTMANGIDIGKDAVNRNL